MTTASTHIQRGGSAPVEARFSAASAGALVARAAAVDAVGLEERAASLGKRSIKRESKLWALRGSASRIGTRARRGRPATAITR